MKNKLGIVLSLILAFSLSNVQAQLSKQEKKEWKKKAKEFAKAPQDLKELMETNDRLNSQISSVRSEVSTLQSRVADRDNRITELQEELARTRSSLSAAQNELRDARNRPVEGPASDYSQGVWFKVQIGAFKGKDLSAYFGENNVFGGEVGPDGLQRITLMGFRDYWDADKFKKYMRDMGVKDAWIVPYQDGQRVEIKDVLEGVIGADKKE
ncbi:MAG TPA: Ezrin/radixin/moesin family protein [Cyclobacteriaceae bacterium]|nr:Ezrin/radixin/moesin family protein [Cyclobacteriaceae bacterium]